jgi:hypothetical protein
MLSGRRDGESNSAEEVETGRAVVRGFDVLIESVRQ